MKRRMKEASMIYSYDFHFTVSIMPLSCFKKHCLLLKLNLFSQITFSILGILLKFILYVSLNIYIYILSFIFISQNYSIYNICTSTYTCICNSMSSHSQLNVYNIGISQYVKQHTEICIICWYSS